MKKKWLVWAAMTTCLLALVGWGLWLNTLPELNCHTIVAPGLPQGFDGYRIAQISDLHNAEFGENNEKLLELLRIARPDMIAITGDLVDSRIPDLQVAREFAAEAVKIAPCYYVSGNHESRLLGYIKLRRWLTELGVTVLEDARVELERNGDVIALAGLRDPKFPSGYRVSDNDGEMMANKLRNLTDQEDFTILLSHRPEFFEAYAQADVELALTGHIHGGQFRLPFVGGMLSPDGTFFPKYDAGIFTEGSTQMVVSRGLGNSLIPLRINNRPEVVLVELKAE